MTEQAAEGTRVLFHIYGLQVTSVVTTEWGVMLVILLLTYFGTRNLKKIPGGVQNVLEFAIDGLYNFFSGILGREKARKYIPFLMTMFVFILLSNYSGLIPGSGHVDGMKAPTSSLSVTAGLAIVVFFTVQIIGIKERGLGYFKRFLQPYIFFLPLNIIEELSRPLSLALRLYGNIFGEEMVVAVLLSLAPYFSPIPIMALSLLMGFIQALVFTLLAAVSLNAATSSHH